MKDLGKYYKSKYLALRAQYIKTVDFAFQEGYVKGQEDSQIQQAQRQAQEAQMQAQQAAAMQAQGMGQGGQPPQQGAEMPPNGEQPPTPGQSPGVPPEAEMYNESPEQIEQLIEELQQAIQKSEGEFPSLQKSLDKLQALQGKNKSMGYATNLSHPGKLALNEQEKLVANLVKKWTNEAPEVANKVVSALRSESVKG